MIDAAHNYGAEGWQMFLRVVIPAGLPTIFTGFRLDLGIALVVIVDGSSSLPIMEWVI